MDKESWYLFCSSRLQSLLYIYIFIQHYVLSIVIRLRLNFKFNSNAIDRRKSLKHKLFFFPNEMKVVVGKVSNS